MFDQQRQLLTRMIEQGTWPHAVLFVGPEGGEKEELVWWFVGQVLKVSEPKNSPDVITIGQDEEKTEGGRTRAIGVERVREVIERLTLAAYEGVKVAVITQSQLMNASSQNALLKTLEEPVGNSLIALSADSAQAFLPTLLSRVMVVEVVGDEKVGNERLSEVRGFLAAGVTERFLLIQKVVKHEEGVAFVERWLVALIAELREGLPKRWRMLDQALVAAQKLGESGNPALLLESIALMEV